MRRWMFLVCVMWMSLAARGESGDVLKALPQYLDSEGRHTLSPSLFARDGYQFYLRMHPKERSGMRMAVQWKYKDGNSTNLLLRVEMRGLKGNTMRTVTLEKPVKKSGWFSNWSEVRLLGAAYVDFGELKSWRVSLWDGDKELSSQQSFLWDGEPPPVNSN